MFGEFKSKEVRFAREILGRRDRVFCLNGSGVFDAKDFPTKYLHILC